MHLLATLELTVQTASKFTASGGSTYIWWGPFWCNNSKKVLLEGQRSSRHQITAMGLSLMNSHFSTRTSEQSL